jgi:DnaK suppressor protein
MATVKQQDGNEEEASLATLPPDYHPSANEEYMCPKHLEYFRLKLEDWKAELLHESIETIHHMQEETHNEPDLADRATTETDRAFELRTRDRERKLINKINDALMRIRDGSYGYCEETDEPIGLARLEARPIATLCLEAQERHERDEKVHSD